MASLPTTLDPGRLLSVVTWLEEQHRLQREEIARLNGELERLTIGMREQTTQIAQLRGELDESRTTLARLPVVDEHVRQAREQLAQLGERLEAHAQHTAQGLLLRSADGERDRRRLTELDQLVGSLRDEGQVQSARLKALAEEARRDRALVESVPGTTEELRTSLVQVSNRVDQLQEMTRRAEKTLELQRSEQAEIRADQAKALEWRQLSEQRWSRQVAEWQQTLQNWRDAAEEQARPVQHLVVQLGQSRDELRTAQLAIGEQARRLEEALAAVGRAEAALGHQRESLGRVEQTLETQRRRLDEQASAHLRLDETIGRAGDHRHGLERALDEQTRALDEMRGAQRGLEDGLTRRYDELTTVLTGLKQELETTRRTAQERLQRLEGTTRENDARLGQLAKTEREHRQRLAAELERQADQLDDGPGRTQSG